MKLPIADRKTAGAELARELGRYEGRDDVLVLAMPRGGVPVAAEIARGLGARLDLILVRKIGTPGHEELAMGAIASGGVRVLVPGIIASLQISQEAIDRVTEKEQQELKRRERTYRGDRPQPAVEGRTVILVDDGVATGATMKAAIEALKQQHPARIVVAVPVAPEDTISELEELADEVVCPATPEPFMAISRWYVNFSQLTDMEVREAMQEAWSR